MADLQDQLQAILGDPEAMGQITAIARALTGGAPQTEEPPPAPLPETRQGDEGYVPIDIPPPTSPTPSAEGLPDLSALMGALGGGAGGIDPKVVQIALRIYGEYSAQDDEKAALLSALRPFLKPERQEKLEKAEKIARLSRVVRVAIQLLREEGENRV